MPRPLVKLTFTTKGSPTCICIQPVMAETCTVRDGAAGGGGEDVEARALAEKMKDRANEFFKGIAMA